MEYNHNMEKDNPEWFIQRLRDCMRDLREDWRLTEEEAIRQKLQDAETPGYEVEFDPDEAERIAFREDALSDDDARESVADL